MNTRKLAGLAVIALVAGCRMPSDLGTPAPIARTDMVELLPVPKMVGVDVTAQVSSPSAQSDYRIQYALSEVAKVAVGIFERSTDTSTNPLLGYFHVGNSAATSSIQLSATEFTNFQTVLGSSIDVGTAAKDSQRRYLMRTFTTPLPTSMTTSFQNFPIATDSIPVHAYNIFVAAFNSYGQIIGYKEADLTYSILSLASPNITLTAKLNYGGLGQINLSRTNVYVKKDATLVVGIFDSAAEPDLGFIDGGTAFDGSSKGYFTTLSGFLSGQGLTDTANSRRYMLKEYASPSVPIGAGTNTFSNVPTGAGRYTAFMMSIRNNTTNAGQYLSGALSVNTDATTSYAAGTYITGEVGTVVGDGTPGSSDTAPIRVSFPGQMVRDATGDFYIADVNNNRIRKFTTGGVVSTVAGGAQGFADTASGSPAFRLPFGVAVDATGTVYVADTGNHAIRKVATNGTVTTIAGDGTAGFLDSASGSVPRFSSPEAIAVDSAGVLYVADFANYAVRKIATNGTVTTLAGGGSPGGYLEGIGTAAKFGRLRGITISPDGSALYVADFDNSHIRKIVIATGQTSKIAGDGTAATLDSAAGSTARFNKPYGVAIDDGGYLYVTEGQGHVVRRIDAASPFAVVRLAGTPGTANFVDGLAINSFFSTPWGIAVSSGSSPSIYVSDGGNNRIRRIK